MKRSFRFRLICLAAGCGLMFSLPGCGNRQDSASGVGDGELQAEQNFERGPHNGRLLREGGFSLEITIFETGVPPEFRVYAFQNYEPIAPNSVDLSIELGRLGNQVDRFNFSAQNDFLRGNAVVLEPHSFNVSVSASHSGGQYQWHYESYEGRTQIEPEVASAMGIEVEQATNGQVRETVALQGTVSPHPDAVTEVRGRFPGLVLSLEKTVGDSVRQGEELARVQSNESLQTYVVTAPQNGTVIERNASVGSASSDSPLYAIADMSRMVADFKIYARDIGRVAVGQTVQVFTSVGGLTSVAGTIERILPTLDPNSRAATARVLLRDTDATWRPGQFVTGIAIVAEHNVSLAVRESGLQSFRDFTVVYAQVADTYEVRMLDLGRRDGEYVEVLGGLEPGTTYVTENSFLVKADIEKSGASHDH
ncbi:MAG: efflux RND transporter periplasmic adaptor subunit [Proteobacteria bacterium]|nr:efflux RND transporter periplasmic adaptor subunit [Pseudomonadota bacterium]MDA0994593.1 efflux RND transporter periplasmic adaptor subunit [Pseudomonadota bacterium]